MTNALVRWVMDPLFRRSPLVAVIGDSHSLFCFCQIAEVRIYWRGPISMHRVGRDGVASILPRWFPHKRFAAIVLVFGEIDCRAHVPVVAARQGTTIDAVIDDLATRYIASTRTFGHKFAGRLAVCCVIPPAFATLPPEAGLSDAEVGRQQVHIRHRLNTRLAELAAAEGIGFIDFYATFAAATGELDVALSDGGVHIDPRQTAAIRPIMMAGLGLPLTHEPLDRDLFLLSVGNYWRRRRQLLDQWFKGRQAAIMRRFRPVE